MRFYRQSRLPRVDLWVINAVITGLLWVVPVQITANSHQEPDIQQQILQAIAGDAVVRKNNIDITIQPINETELLQSTDVEKLIKGRPSDSTPADISLAKSNPNSSVVETASLQKAKIERVEKTELEPVSEMGVSDEHVPQAFANDSKDEKPQDNLVPVSSLDLYLPSGEAYSDIDSTRKDTTSSSGEFYQQIDAGHNFAEPQPEKSYNIEFFGWAPLTDDDQGALELNKSLTSKTTEAVQDLKQHIKPEIWIILVLSIILLLLVTHWLANRAIGGSLSE